MVGRGAMAVVAVLVLVRTAAAEPVLGTAIDYAPPVGADDGRLGASLYLLGASAGGVVVGGELAGTLGGHLGGWGCNADPGDDGEVAPAVAVFCFEPSFHAHAIAGRAIDLGARHRLRLEAGLGATLWLLLAGQGGDARADLAASGLVRASWLVRLGDGFGGRWWTGLVVEERDYLAADRPPTGSIGLVLEAFVVD